MALQYWQPQIKNLQAAGVSGSRSAGVQVSDAEMNQIVSHHAAQFQGKDRENFIRMAQVYS